MDHLQWSVRLDRQDEKYSVQPGDIIVSSVTMKDDRTYTMNIASTMHPSKTISTDYQLESRQVSPL